MNDYKIHKEGYSVIKKFSTLSDAQTFANTLGEGYTVELYREYVPPTLRERLLMDMEFGRNLIYVFVEDNRAMEITTVQSEKMLVKFRDILAFAQIGAILSIYTHLPNIAIDDVFTQERKDKYEQMISYYMLQT